MIKWQNTGGKSQQATDFISFKEKLDKQENMTKWSGGNYYIWIKPLVIQD